MLTDPGNTSTLWLGRHPLAGVARGAASNPDQITQQLAEEIRTAASAIRTLTPAELGKQGIHNCAGEVTVGCVIENFVVIHAKQHAAQVRASLAAGG
jgi:hypothetical protein